MANDLQMITLSVQVPAFVGTALDKLSKQYGMSRAELIRDLLRDCADLTEEIIKESTNVRIR